MLARYKSIWETLKPSEASSESTVIISEEEKTQVSSVKEADSTGLDDKDSKDDDEFVPIGTGKKKFKNFLNKGKGAKATKLTKEQAAIKKEKD